MNFRELPPSEVLAPQLREWFASEIGQELLAAERSAVERILPTLFGYYMAQIGVDSQVQMFDACPIRHKFVLAGQLELGLPASSLVCRADSLPLDGNSLDAVMLHHALDFAANPHQVLREAARVVRPGGHIVIVGFNPLSSWGISRSLCLRRKVVPWNGHFISQRRLSDWLGLLELTEVKVLSDYFQFPFQRRSWRRRSGFMSALNSQGQSGYGAFTVLLARKDVVGITPIKQEFRKRRLINIPVPEPTARGHHVRDGQ